MTLDILQCSKILDMYSSYKTFISSHIEKSICGGLCLVANRWWRVYVPCNVVIPKLCNDVLYTKQLYSNMTQQCHH
jgi:hypothetical protein